MKQMPTPGRSARTLTTPETQSRQSQTSISLIPLTQPAPPNLAPNSPLLHSGQMQIAPQPASPHSPTAIRTTPKTPSRPAPENPRIRREFRHGHTANLFNVIPEKRDTKSTPITTSAPSRRQKLPNPPMQPHSISPRRPTISLLQNSFNSTGAPAATPNLRAAES